MSTSADRSHRPPDGSLSATCGQTQEGRLLGASCSDGVTVSSTVVDGKAGSGAGAGGGDGSIENGGISGGGAGTGGSNGGVPSSRGAGGGAGRSQPADRQQARCCRGLTYFSQAMLDTGKLPVSVNDQQMDNILSFSSSGCCISL